VQLVNSLFTKYAFTHLQNSKCVLPVEAALYYRKPANELTEKESSGLYEGIPLTEMPRNKPPVSEIHIYIYIYIYICNEDFGFKTKRVGNTRNVPGHIGIPHFLLHSSRNTMPANSILYIV